MADAVRIDVEGIKILRRELKALDMHRDLQKVNKSVAEDVVVPVAKRFGMQSRPNLAGGISRLGSRGVAAIRATATQSKAFVVSGKKAIPYAGGAEFGSAGRYRQFPIAKKGGYILYPAIAETGPKIVETYVERLDKLMAPVFPRGRIST